jgi:hypothetical protein
VLLLRYLLCLVHSFKEGYSAGACNLNRLHAPTGTFFLQLSLCSKKRSAKLLHAPAGTFGLQFSHTPEDAVWILAQFGGVALFDDFAVFQHDDLVCCFDGAHAVRDHKDGL